jgi:uncharacterized membrane protein YwaF
MHGGVVMLDALRRWLVGNMGNLGNYQYQAIHLYTVLAVVAVLILVAVIGGSKKVDARNKQHILVGISIFQLIFEIFWRVIYVTVKGDDLSCWWPAYPCNLAGILLHIVALCNWEQGKKLFYLFGFVGGVLTFALPDGIFVRDVMVFPVLKSVLQHTGLLMIPMLEYAMGKFRPSLRDMPWVILGLLVHLANSEGMTRLLGLSGDFMFFRSGLPFVIPGVPQFITLSVFALLVLTGLSFVSDPKDSLECIRPIKKKQA